MKGEVMDFTEHTIEEFMEDVGHLLALRKARDELSAKVLNSNIKVDIGFTSASPWDSGLRAIVQKMIEDRNFNTAFWDTVNNWLCSDISDVEDKIEEEYGISIQKAE